MNDLNLNTSTKVVRIKKLHADAQMPTYATEGSAAFDLYAATVDVDKVSSSGTIVDTGLAFEIPAGYCMKVYSRSGSGFKHNVRLSNCVGIIDSDYRGPLKIKLIADTLGIPMSVKVGDRVAQGIIVPVEQVAFSWVESLASTERGAGGFGSTGL